MKDELTPNFVSVIHRNLNSSQLLYKTTYGLKPAKMLHATDVISVIISKLIFHGRSQVSFGAIVTKSKHIIGLKDELTPNFVSVIHRNLNSSQLLYKTTYGLRPAKMLHATEVTSVIISKLIFHGRSQVSFGAIVTKSKHIIGLIYIYIYIHIYFCIYRYRYRY